MNSRRLAKLQRQLDSLRGQGGVNRRDVESLARALGRRRVQRGKEPTWDSVVFPESRSVTIPSHSGDLNRFTKDSILDQLEEDIERWEEEVSGD
jgi:hypothetical protein